ncbi:MAG: hypothetical protein WKG00_41730 [Polyangiaceae bacterium]
MTHLVSSPSSTVIWSRHGIMASRIELSYSKVSPESASSAELGSLPFAWRGIQKSRSTPWGVRTARKRTGPAGGAALALRAPKREPISVAAAADPPMRAAKRRRLIMTTSSFR